MTRNVSSVLAAFIRQWGTFHPLLWTEDKLGFLEVMVCPSLFSKDVEKPLFASARMTEAASSEETV